MLVRGDQGHGWQNSVEHFRPHISFGVLERQGESEAVCEEALSSLPGKKNQSVSQEWRSSMILQGRGPERVLQTQIRPHISFGVLKRQNNHGLRGGLVLPFVGKRKKCHKKGGLQ